MLLQADRSCLLLVDIQARLAPAVLDPDQVITRAGILRRAADTLAIPVIASEQYPKGLGPTVPELRATLEEHQILSKTTFSCFRDEKLASQVRQLARMQVVVGGMEAHVCVLQTVVDLLHNRFSVFVVADAISSRLEQSRVLAIARMREAGAAIVTTEMVLFEWLERADHPQFRALSSLIK
jgi:nicotinamidase-related amidase